MRLYGITLTFHYLSWSIIVNHFLTWLILDECLEQCNHGHDTQATVKHTKVFHNHIKMFQYNIMLQEYHIVMQHNCSYA